MQEKYLQIDPKDTLLVALQDLPTGTTIHTGEFSFPLQEAIRAKHKFAATPFDTGDEMIMYGVCVGKATQPIPRGAAIRTSNMAHSVAPYGHGKGKASWQGPDVSRFLSREFRGYHRADGRVGTENNWLVIPLVFCENRNLEMLEEILLEPLGYTAEKDFRIDLEALIRQYRQGASAEELKGIEVIRGKSADVSARVFPNVDGIRFLKHQGGCGGSPSDSEALCRLLAGYITHPNVAGATVLSLGCQQAQIGNLRSALLEIDPHFNKPLYFLDQQKSGTEEEFIAQAVKKTFEGLTIADQCTRKPAPLSKLILGLECGGSDGFSGISANPALGHASDMLVALGGSAVLSEFPELNGVEQELISRCTTKTVAGKFMKLMKQYARAAARVGAGFENNPSPGNIRDGLITDAMKSAGAARKGGSSPVTDVLDYAEQVRKPGLNLLCTPGNDVESTTGLAGSGCNIIVFTTGLGTPTGNPVCPVIKVASNSEMNSRMSDIIDLDAGPIIRGEQSPEEIGETLLDLVIRVASGEMACKARIKGQNDFIPWKRGISL